MKKIILFHFFNMQKSILFIFVDFFIFEFVSLLILAACSNSKMSDTDKDFLYSGTPFKSADDANWGMVSNDGTIIFSDEFDRLPTRVSNERFLVKDKDSLWTYYKAEKKPSRIGKHYVYATDFSRNNYAIASEMDDGIITINKSGKTVWEANKVIGQLVDGMSEFNSKGLALFSCGQNLGVINSDGRIILKPEYCKILLGAESTQIIAISNKYQSAYQSKNYKNVVATIFDENGENIGNISLNKYTDITASFDNLIVAYEKQNEDTICGLIDQKGNWVVKANHDILKIIDCKFNVFIYYDGDKFGLKRTNGDDLIRAKYDFIRFADDGLLWAYSISDNVASCKLIDFNDQQVGKDSYKYGSTFNNGYAIAKISDNDWTFINREGEENHKGPNISLLRHNTAPNWVYSNYLDISDFVNSLKISSTTLNDMSLDLQIPQAIAIAYRKNDTIQTGNRISNNTEDYILKSEIEFSNMLHGVYYSSRFLYQNPISKDEKEDSNKPVAIEIAIPNILNANGKLTRIFKQIDKIIRKFGKVIKFNNNAIIIAGDSLDYELIMAGDYVQLNYIRKNYINVKNIEIDEYRDIKEKNFLKLNINLPENNNTGEEYMYNDSVTIDNTTINY